MHTKHCCPIQDRKLEIVDAEGSTHKFTINPVDGRMTLKIPKKSSDMVREDLRMFAYHIASFTTFKPATMRGRMSFNKTTRKYRCTLYNGSKTFKESFSWSEEIS